MFSENKEKDKKKPRKAGVLKFLRFQERFQKLSFRAAVDYTPNRRVETAFSNFSCVV